MTQSFSVLAPRRRETTSAGHLAAVEAVVAAIRSRPDAPLDLGEMAEVAGVSRSHLDRVFREITGISPRQFQTSLRVNHAMRLLLTTDQSVTDVCFEVGYESLGSFITRFTQSFGLAPQKLRSLAAQLDRPWGDWLDESKLLHLSGNAPKLFSVRGTIETSATLFGPIFIGLFPTPMPLGPPLACSVIRRPGGFEIGTSRSGRSYLLAVGIPSSERPLDFLLNQQTMRGAAQWPVHPAAGEAREWNIVLRPPLPLDPPINLALPFLIVLRQMTFL